MLLGINVFLGHLQVIVVIETASEILENLVGALPSAQDSRGALSDTHRVTYPVAAAAVYGITLDKELVVRHQTGAYIDAVDTVDQSLRPGYGLEILALGDNGPGNAGIVGIRYGLHQHVGCQDGDSETAHPVGLHGKTALTGHSLNDHPHIGSGLHGLI